MLRVNNKANITTSSRSGVFIVNFEQVNACWEVSNLCFSHESHVRAII